MKSAVLALAGALVAVLGMVSLAAVSSSADAMSCLPLDVEVAGDVPGSSGLSPEQRANARTIVGAVIARRMPTRAAVIAVATAMQESDLRNLARGDADSVGLFQQRASAGWGSTTAAMDPIEATNAFLDRLDQVRDWPVLQLAVAAQDVQHSAFPDAYSKWEPAATRIVNSLLARPDTEDEVPGTEPTDFPGLFAVGGDLLSKLTAEWPSTFQGGPVNVDAAGGGRPVRIIGELMAHQKDLPGTLVIGPDATAPKRKGLHQRKRHRSRAGAQSQVDAIMHIAGPDRTVYWIKADAGLTAPESAKYPRLQILDTAGEMAAHPQWADNGRPNTPGLAGLRTYVSKRLGLAPDSVASEAGTGCDDGLGGYGSVPVPDCGFQLARGNPRSCQNAIRWALAQSDGPAVWHRKCLHFVAKAYGWTASGTGEASGFWANAPDKHPNDPNPPAGALVFWSTDGPDGHVAISASGGMVVSNDIAGAGTVAAVPLAQITTGWHATYLGWATPFFPHGL